MKNTVRSTIVILFTLVLIGLIVLPVSGVSAQGGNLLTNGDFSSGNLGWTWGTGWSNTGSVATAVSSVSSLTSSFILQVGATYQLTYTVNVVSGGMSAWVGNSSTVFRTVSGTYSEIIVAKDTTVLKFQRATGFTGSVDDVSLVFIPSSPNSVLLNPAFFQLAIAGLICFGLFGGWRFYYLYLGILYMTTYHTQYRMYGMILLVVVMSFHYLIASIDPVSRGSSPMKDIT
jgi:hypothetical protein